MRDARSHLAHAHVVHAMHLHRTGAVHPHPRALHAMHAAAPEAAPSDHVPRTPAGTIAEARAVAIAAISITVSAVAVPVVAIAIVAIAVTAMGVVAIAITAVPLAAMPPHTTLTIVRRISAFFVSRRLLGCAEQRRVEGRTLVHDVHRLRRRIAVRRAVAI